MIRQLLTLLISIFLFACNNPEKSARIEKETLKLLPSPVDSVSAEPYLFSDKNGKVYLSWIEIAKDTSFLKFSSLSNDEWSKPVVITSGDNWFVNWADYPMLASDGEGNMIAHILEKSENGTYTYDVKLFVSSDKGANWIP